MNVQTMKGPNMTTKQPNCHFNIKYYNFTPSEVRALYDLIMYMGWLPHSHQDDNDKIRLVVNRICEIVESNGMATGNSQTT